MVSKVKDGLFLGDIEASQDPEFIELNKISRIINCAPSSIPNIWACHGIRYLTLDWDEDGEGALFDPHGALLKQVKSFIEQAHALGECVLIHDVDGGSRSITITAAYLMYTYYWGLEKAMEYLLTKRPDIAMQKNFIEHLLYLDRQLRSQRSKTHPAYLRARVTGWDPKALENELLSSSRDANEIDRPNDELILVNTFVNSQHLIKSIPRIPLSFEDHRPRTIRWLDGSDGKTRGHGSLERPGNASYNSDEITTSELAPSKEGSCLRSILKGTRPRTREDKQGLYSAQEKQTCEGAKRSSSSSSGSKRDYDMGHIETKQSKGIWMEESPRKRLEHLLDEVHEHQTSHHRHDSASTDSLRDLQRDLVSARSHQKSRSDQLDMSSLSISSSASESKSFYREVGEAKAPPTKPTAPSRYTRMGAASLYDDLKKGASSSIAPPKPFTVTTRARQPSSRPSSAPKQAVSSSSHVDTPRPPIMISPSLLTTKPLRPSSASPSTTTTSSSTVFANKQKPSDKASATSTKKVPVRAQGIFPSQPVKERSSHPSPYESFLSKAVKGSPRPTGDGLLSGSPAPASMRTYRQGTPPRKASRSSSSATKSTSSSRNATSTSAVRMLSSATIQRLSTPRRQTHSLDSGVYKSRPASPVVTSSTRSRPASPSVRGSTPTRPSSAGGLWK